MIFINMEFDNFECLKSNNFEKRFLFNNEINNN